MPERVPEITVGDIDGGTGFAASSMVWPGSLGSIGGRFRILTAGNGKKASISLSVMRFDVGEDPNLSGKRLLLTIWPSVDVDVN